MSLCGNHFNHDHSSPSKSGDSQGDTKDGGVMPGDRLRDPRAQRTADVVGFTEHRDPRHLGQVDTRRHRAHRALHVEQSTQCGVRYGLEVHLVGAVLDPQRGVQRRVVQTRSHHQEITVVRIALPLAASARHFGEQRGVGMRPLQRRTLFGGMCADVVPHDRQVAQVVGSLGVHFLCAHLVVGAAVERGRRQQQDEREEQRRRRHQPHAGGDQRDDHADDQDDDQIRQHPSQQ